MFIYVNPHIQFVNIKNSFCSVFLIRIPDMEMKIGYSATSPGRRRLLNIDGDVVNAKCTKRRRRDPLGVTLSSSDQQHGDNQQQQQTSQGGHPTAPPAATTVKRSSRFRGVSRHRWTGRYEAHLWDKGSWNPTQRKKGKQVYLGAYDDEESAARAYDLAALKYWGTSTFTNFPVPEYEKELEMMKNMTKEEYLATLRRRSSGFSRGVSKYRGVARHHHNGRWEARIGRVFGNKYLYLGTYSTQEEAAHAYDIAAIEYRGINAVTNFDLSTYIRWLKPDSNANTPQDTKSASCPLPAFDLSHQIVSEKENQLSILHQPNPYMIHDFNTPKRPDIFQIKSPTSTGSSALGLLLKSSVFKDLVEKNLNTAEEDEEINTKILPLAGNGDGMNDIFFDGISQGPYLYPSEKDSTLPGLESKEERSKLSLYNGLGHSLWSGSFNFSSFQ